MPHRIEQTDEDLLDDYASGDAGAFRLLIERHHDALMRFLFRLTGSVQAAEDVFQDAFLQVHQSLHTFDRTRRFKPWLFTIAANKARDLLRRENRRSALSLSANIDDDEGGSFVDLMSIDLPHPSSDIEAQEQAEMVQNAISRMPYRLRETLLLAYFQKMTYSQIAEVCGIPLGTVKSRLHAAVAAFAQHWNEELNDSRTKRAGGASPQSASQ